MSMPSLLVETVCNQPSVEGFRVLGFVICNQPSFAHKLAHERILRTYRMVSAVRLFTSAGTSPVKLYPARFLLTKAIFEIDSYMSNSSFSIQHNREIS